MSSAAWSQLVSTSDISADPVEISKDKFIIGRSKTADLCLIGNKLVSGTHCFIEKDAEGKVWLQDTSTNGTLLNFHQKLIGTRKELKHGDEIHLIYKKSEEHLNLSYVFQDLQELAKEEADLTEDYSETEASGTSQTLPGEDSPLRKRHRTDFSDEESLEIPLEKKWKKTETETSKKPTEENKSEAAVALSEKTAVEKEDKKQDGAKDKHDKTPEVGISSAMADGMEESLLCIICQEILHDCVSCQPCMHTFCGGCYSDWMERSNECPSCRLKVKQVGKNHTLNNLVEVYLKSHPGKKRPEAELKELDAKNKIKSKTMKPPMPERSVSELMDEDSLYDEDGDGADDEHEHDDDDDDEEDYENSEDAEAPGTGGTGFGMTPGGGGWFGATPHPFTGMTGAFGTIRPPRTVCRQCPGYRDPHAVSPIAAATSALSTALAKAAGLVTGGTTGTDAGTSTGAKDEDAKVMPEPPKFTCSPTQTHILCSCCLQPMPHRGSEATGGSTPLPKIQCSLCHRTFCQLYWGCRKAECLGCLGKFREMNFGNKVLGNIVLENSFESDILKNHLDEKGVTIKDMLRECCDKMKAGDYTTLDQVRGFSAESTVCYACGLRNFRELAYQYRQNLTADDLPAAVTSRPDCYWGKNCRTQKNKIGHAAKFNHICEQTK